MRANLPNIDPKTVRDFGKEWSTFDQSGVPGNELDEIFERYFGIFPWDRLPPGAVGMDVGCGSGRWAQRVAPRVGLLHCIDASEEALGVARSNLAQQENCRLHLATVDELPIDPGTLDFGYSLGVLHHLPDPEQGLRCCVERLKVGAPFLVYLYYALDDRSPLYRAIWQASNLVRRITSRLPHAAKLVLSTIVAALVYLPLARFARIWEAFGRDPESVPLSFYRQLSFYTMRTDALDRFGTRLEKRFRKLEVASLMERAGLENVSVSTEPPYWCAVGFRRTK